MCLDRVLVTVPSRCGTAERTWCRAVLSVQGVRDTIIASGMENGMRETMDALDELVASPR
jgi:hypothetical protein